MAGQDLTSKSVPISSKGFNGGLNSTASPLTVAQNESSKLLNIDFDKFGSIMKRAGTININTSAISSYINVTNSGFENWSTLTEVLSNGGMETWTGLTDVLTNGNMETWTAPWLRSNADIDNEDMADITDWTDDDGVNGVSSQVTFDSKSCMKLDSGAAAASTYAARSQDIGSMGASTVFSANFYFDALGTAANNDALFFIMVDGTHRLQVTFASDGLGIVNSSGSSAVIGTNPIVQDVWQEWTFKVTWGASATVDIYLNGALFASGVDCAYNEPSGFPDGKILFQQNGATTSNRITYVNWFYAGSAFAQPLTNWALQGSIGETLHRESTTIKAGTYSAKLTRNGATTSIQQDAWTNLGGGTVPRGKKVVFGCWVWCDTATNARIYLYDGTTSTPSDYHSGGSSWEYLTASATVGAAATSFLINCQVRNVDGFAYFDSAIAYEQLAPTGWSLSGAGATVAREESTIKVGTYSAKVTENGALVEFYQVLTGGTAWRNKVVTFGCWVYASSANNVYIKLNDGVTETYSSPHSGVAGWEYLTVTHTVSATATNLVAEPLVEVGGGTAYFDGATAYEMITPTGWTPDGAGTITEREFSIIYSETYSAKVKSVSANSRIYQALSSPTSYRSKSLTFGCWVYSSSPSSSRISLYDNVSGFSYSLSYHSGNSSWEYITVTKDIHASASIIELSLHVLTGSYTAYFDLVDLSFQGASQVTGLHWYEPSTSTDALIATIGTNIYSNDLSSTFTDITGTLTITPTYLWKFCTFLNTVFGTNGIDAPWKWTGTGNAAAMTLPTNCTIPKWVIQFQAYLFIADSVVGGVRERSRLNWGVINSGDTWLDTDFAYISRNDGQDITGLGVLGDRIVIFKDRSIWIGQFTGDVDIPFQFQKTQSHVGCASGYSIQNVANGLVFMGEDGIYFFDGNQSEKLSNRINSTIYANALLQQDNTVSMYQKFKNRTWFSQTASGQTESDSVITWDDYNNAFSVYGGMKPSAMCMVYSGGQEIPVFGDYIGNIYKADIGVNDVLKTDVELQDDDGLTIYDDDDLVVYSSESVNTSIEAYFYTKWVDYDDLVNSKGLVQLDVYYQYNNATLNTVYSYNFEDGDSYTLPINTSGGTYLWNAFTWDNGKWAGSGGGHYRLDLTGRGRVVRIGFKNNVIDETFRVDGIGQLVHLETNQ